MCLILWNSSEAKLPVILSAGEIPKFYFGGCSINKIQNYYSNCGV